MKLRDVRATSLDSYNAGLWADNRKLEAENEHLKADVESARTFYSICAENNSDLRSSIQELADKNEFLNTHSIDLLAKRIEEGRKTFAAWWNELEITRKVLEL